LSLSRNHPREKKICKISARQKQHKQRGGLEQQEERQSVKVELFAKLQDIQGAARIGPRVELRKSAREIVKRGSGLRDRDARLQARESRKRQPGAIRLFLRSQRQGHPSFHRHLKAKAPPHESCNPA